MPLLDALTGWLSTPRPGDEEALRPESLDRRERTGRRIGGVVALVPLLGLGAVAVLAREPWFLLWAVGFACLLGGGVAFLVMMPMVLPGIRSMSAAAGGDRRRAQRLRRAVLRRQTAALDDDDRRRAAAWARSHDALSRPSRQAVPIALGGLWLTQLGTIVLGRADGVVLGLAWLWLVAAPVLAVASAWETARVQRFLRSAEGT